MSKFGERAPKQRKGKEGVSAAQISQTGLGEIEEIWQRHKEKKERVFFAL